MTIVRKTAIARKTLSISFAAVILSTGAAFSQVGGGDVPTNAKKQGTMENGPGTTGMSKSEAKGGMMKKDGMMKKEGGMMKQDKM